MRSSWMPSLAAALLPILLAACEGSDTVSLRVRIAPDLSGQIDASTFSLPEEAHALEAASAGVEWRDRARMTNVHGAFTELNALAIEDLRFAAEARADGSSHVRVTLPRGEAARWHRLFTVADARERERLARTLDPKGGARRAGGTVRIVLETPAPILSVGFRPHVRGVSSDSKQLEASLSVSLEALRSGTEELIWQISW